MRNVSAAAVAAGQERIEELPGSVQEALGELAGAAKEGLLALSVGVGLGVLHELMEAEVNEVVGPKGKHDPNRTAVRHGHERGEVTLGGRRVPLERPRARTADGEHEIGLDTYAHVAARDQLTDVMLERMLAGADEPKPRDLLLPANRGGHHPQRRREAHPKDLREAEVPECPGRHRQGRDRELLRLRDRLWLDAAQRMRRVGRLRRRQRLGYQRLGTLVTFDGRRHILSTRDAHGIDWTLIPAHPPRRLHSPLCWAAKARTHQHLYKLPYPGSRSPAPAAGGRYSERLAPSPRRPRKPSADRDAGRLPLSTRPVLADQPDRGPPHCSFRLDACACRYNWLHSARPRPRLLGKVAAFPSENGRR
jgi:hypothetical protein